MKTITFKAYEFDELSEKAQNVVADRYKKDAIFKNPESIFTESLNRTLNDDMIQNLKDIIIFDSTRLKIKPIRDVKFKLSEEGVKKDSHFLAVYGDGDDLNKIINAEYTINYDGRNIDKIKVTTNDDVGVGGVQYYLSGIMIGTIKHIMSMVKSTMEVARSTYDVRKYVQGMLFHIDGSDLTEGEKLVVKEREISN